MSVPSLLPPSTAPSSMLLLVTGASRGFGRAIVTVASQHVSKLRAILVARSDDGLQETAEAMKTTRTATRMDPKEVGDGLVVSCHVMDLSDLDHLDENLNALLQQTVQLGHDDDVEAIKMEDASTTRAANFKSYDHIVFINNAGSIGHIGLSWKSPSLQEMRENVDLNVTSSLWTSVRFVRHITSLLDEEQSSLSLSSTTTATTGTAPVTNQSRVFPKITIVNVSSLVAIADFPTLGIYSAGKASRDKYHALMALELTKSAADADAAAAGAATTPGSTADSGSNTPSVSVPMIKILNYAPGPLETDMVTEIRQAPALDESLKPHYEKPQLSPEQSAQKLVKLLLSNDFASGSHIDYYDLPEE